MPTQVLLTQIKTNSFATCTLLLPLAKDQLFLVIPPHFLNKHTMKKVALITGVTGITDCP